MDNIRPIVWGLLRDNIPLIGRRGRRGGAHHGRPSPGPKVRRRSLPGTPDPPAPNYRARVISTCLAAHAPAPFCPYFACVSRLGLLGTPDPPRPKLPGPCDPHVHYCSKPCVPKKPSLRLALPPGYMHKRWKHQCFHV
jgi:hypothetical protein